MKTETIFVLVIVMAFVIFAFQFPGLFAVTEFVTTPTWHFKFGCVNEDCYGGNYNIGKLGLSAGTPYYTKEKTECRFERKWIAYEEENKACWKQEFTFGREKFEIIPNEVTKLNKYIEVTWVPTGIIHNGNVCHPRWGFDDEGNKIRIGDECHYVDYTYDWQDPQYMSDFTFSIYNTDFFNTTIKNKLYTITEESFVIYNIYNDLTQIDGGAVIKETFQLWSPSNVKKTEYFEIYEGDNNYKSSITTATIGNIVISVESFMIVYNDVMGSKSTVYIYSNEDEKETRVLPYLEHIPSQDRDFWRRNPPSETADIFGFSTGADGKIQWNIFMVILIGFIIYYYGIEKGPKRGFIRR